MVGSGKEPNKSIDATVGGLVWVRRRNGSWWPGKILGPDELPEGCVPTPRSGTPVKLLGREDSSFEWYNLEKSKRVKAFHCSEYDECIKKVMESVSQLSKKGVKYAQREDAILHALELERARLGKDGPDLSDSDISADDSDSAQEVPEAHPTLGGPDRVDSAQEESKQCRTQIDSENDDSEGVKRMRGLEDLGMGVSPSAKKKRSQIAHVELLKRKNRHRTLTKVMATATMVSLPITSEVKVSGLESNESKKNSSVVINSNSVCNVVSFENEALLKDEEISSLWEDPENGSLQKLFDVPLVADEQHSAGFSSVVSDASHPTRVNAKADSNQSSCLEAVSSANEEHNRSDPTSSSTVNIDSIGPSSEKGSCEWRFKGKRNSRPRKVESEAETHVAGVDRETLSTTSGRNHRQLPYRQSRFTVNPKYDDSDFSLRRHVAVSGLYDVSVEVKTGYRAEHVPYISLMSKLTGRPVVGHPLAIEVSECCEVEHRKPSSRPRSRKKAALTSKKTRKLSSLTGSGREERKKGVVEKMKGPSVACVPLKVVFSRINAALSGSSVGMK